MYYKNYFNQKFEKQSANIERHEWCPTFWGWNYLENSRELHVNDL